MELLTEDGALNYAAYLLADENGLSIKVAKYRILAKYWLLYYISAVKLKQEKLKLPGWVCETHNSQVITGNSQLEKTKP